MLPFKKTIYLLGNIKQNLNHYETISNMILYLQILTETKHTSIKQTEKSL